MISQERLAMQGAAAALAKDVNRLRLQAKGHGANIRGACSIYALQHIDEFDIDSFEVNAALFVKTLRELRSKEADLREIEEGL